MADYKKPDHWQLKAQKEGYPARSVYKLAEIDQKFGLFKNSGSRSREFKVLDLGAAPGSWSLYVMRNFSVKLAAVDLSPLSRQYDKGLFDHEHFCFIQGDMTSPQVREKIISLGPFNLVMSDAAPATTGNRSIDTARSLELAQAVIAYAESALVSGGNLLIKVFQGGDTTNILKQIKEMFASGKSYKPQACRSESFETYYVGLGKI